MARSSGAILCDRRSQTQRHQGPRRSGTPALAVSDQAGIPVIQVNPAAVDQVKRASRPDGAATTGANILWHLLAILRMLSVLHLAPCQSLGRGARAPIAELPMPRARLKEIVPPCPLIGYAISRNAVGFSLAC
jgi:hypothetical protein